MTSICARHPLLTLKAKHESDKSFEVKSYIIHTYIIHTVQDNEHGRILIKLT